MTIVLLLVVLAAFGVAGTAATVRAVLTDGYGPVPTRRP